MKSFVCALGLAAVSGALWAQEFEVASIKVVDQKRLEQECQNVQSGRRGGPGTENPLRVVYECQPLQLLVLEAFGFADSEAFRIPNLEAKIEWTNFVNVRAIVPAGTSPAEYRALLRNLLAKRYNLKSHEETREGDVYELSVFSGGHKLKSHVESSDEAKPVPSAARNARVGPDGLVGLAPVPGQVLATGRRDHWRVLGSDVPIQPLAERIEGILHAPVVDKTGLSGTFDFQLDFDPGYGAPADTGVGFPLLPTALRDQLGLAVKKTKGPVKIVLIDSIDPTPSEN